MKTKKIWDYETMSRIWHRLQEAREKHPVFASSRDEAFAVIAAEFSEFEHAVLEESQERQDDEALDVIATCFRFLNREWQ